MHSFQKSVIHASQTSSKYLPKSSQTQHNSWNLLFINKTHHTKTIQMCHITQTKLLKQYFNRVYIYQCSHTPTKPVSTMYIHLHCSVSTMLQSAQKSKHYLSHNACKHIVHEHLLILHVINLSWTRLCLSTLSHITNHNINYVHTSTLQCLNDTAIITKFKVILASIKMKHEAILILQCMQTCRTP